jgi:hypothetical protein
MVNSFMTTLLLSVTVLAAGACAQPEQSSECAQYIECIRAIDEREGVTTDAKRFDPSGACWGGPEGADLCTRACLGGIAYLQKAYTDLPEVCQ